MIGMSWTVEIQTATLGVHGPLLACTTKVGKNAPFLEKCDT